MNINLESYTADKKLLWDDFVAKCPMATFLHSRKFLSYHKDKFQEQSLLFFDDKNRLVGVFPAASRLSQNEIIISHPGSTFGGIVHNGKLVGAEITNVLQLIIDFYRNQGAKEILYKAVPYVYHQAPYSDDLYSLFSLNAILCRRDLSCAINLLQPTFLTCKDQSKLRNCIRKAEKNELAIKEGVEYLPQLWEILAINLKEKYDTNPVHSFEEIKHLMILFPDNIKAVVAVIGNNIVAGTILFSHKTVCHTQYLVVTDVGMKIFALDALIQHCIVQAKENGYSYFDFGINNEQEGKILNHTLYLSKVKHGGGGVVHDFYKIILK